MKSPLSHAAGLLVVTGSIPFSDDEEAFVQDEVTEMLRQGTHLRVVPMRRHRRLPNEAAILSGLAEVSVATSLLSLRVVVGATTTMLRRPVRTLRAVTTALRHSGSAQNLKVNLISTPKALWIAGLVRREGWGHIHAYWLSHTSTAAMIASSIERVPWSATGYRWDIDAANALETKIRTSRFVRSADELGFDQLIQAARTVGDAATVELVRTGVSIPEPSSWAHIPIDPSLWVCPATMVEKKGHDVLLDALSIVAEDHPSIALHLFGEGPRRPLVEKRIRELDLADRVVFHGVVPLGALRDFFTTRRPVCVLPSIQAADGQQEGIPVTLVEAMAHGAPVVSTRSGSIATLVLPGTGTLVEPGNVKELSEALSAIIADPEAADRACRAAARRLEGEFDLAYTAARMVALTAAPAGAAGPEEVTDLERG